MSYNLASLFERVVGAVPDRGAIVTPSRRLTYAELDDRANRLACFLQEHGVGQGSYLGLQLRNGTEYLEAMLAAFKLRAIPVNINYRYVAGELAGLYDDAGISALVVDFDLLATVRAAESRTARPIPLVLAVGGGTYQQDRGATAYDTALDSGAPTFRCAGRSGDDLYLAYTGGTTGRPKGVLWRHEDIFFAAMGGGDPTTALGPITEPDELVGRIMNPGVVMLSTPPLVHVSAQWGVFSTLFGGGTVVLPPGGPIDAGIVWSLVAAERVNVLTVVGNAMARPLLDFLAANPVRHDLSSLLVFASGGAVLSPSSKEQIAALLPNVITVDGYGSTETGVGGARARMPGAAIDESARFPPGESVRVVDDDFVPIPPGSGAVGQVVRRGRLPLGYHNDPEKTAATFVTIDGERWACSGDAATVEADGSIVLLGRGSVSINTGGEKVYPEEVEQVIKDHPTVYDAVVVGAADARWGERVVAVVSCRPGTEVSLDELQAHCRLRLAGYKVPRALVVVDTVQRSPTGKADYTWARSVVADELSEA
ncbi:MAG: acyl-CoA synthetase [Acidimicrobiia bacterium]